MAKVTFNTDMCKGCGLCVDACPKGCIAIADDRLNQKGYSPAYMKESENTAAMRPMFVSPKEINEIVSAAAQVIGGGINQAFGIFI